MIFRQADGSIKLGHKNAHWKEKTEFRDSDLDPVRDENAKYWTWFWVNKVNYVFPPEFVLTGVSFARYVPRGEGGGCTPLI